MKSRLNLKLTSIDKSDHMIENLKKVLIQKSTFGENKWLHRHKHCIRLENSTTVVVRSVMCILLQHLEVITN